MSDRASPAGSAVTVIGLNSVGPVSFDACTELFVTS